MGYPPPMSLYDFTVKTIDGHDKSLADYRGKALLIVNVASKCGYTPQYEGLEKLHETYFEKGLAVLGFPANEFGAQEPGTDAEIKTFCTTNFGVKFDMFAKLKVKGEGIHPLFAFLTKDARSDLKGDIKWNFEKFLVAKDGTLLTRFASGADPMSADVRGAVDKALAG